MSALLAFSTQACSSEPAPGTGTGTGGTGAGSGGTGTAGTGTAGTGTGTGAGGTGTAGTTGAGGTGTSGGGGTGTAGTGTAGTGTAGAAGSAGSAGTAGTGGGGGSAGGGGTLCPTTEIKDMMTPCTASCTGYLCGVHELGSKDCECTAASIYDCGSCTYTSSDPIAQPPEANSLPDCVDPGGESADDIGANLEDVAAGTCTAGERCYYVRDSDSKARMCACYGTPSEWDCDSYPSGWPAQDG